jgi:hypothetical protein
MDGPFEHNVDAHRRLQTASTESWVRIPPPPLISLTRFKPRCVETHDPFDSKNGSDATWDSPGKLGSISRRTQEFSVEPAPGADHISLHRNADRRQRRNERYILSRPGRGNNAWLSLRFPTNCTDDIFLCPCLHFCCKLWRNNRGLPG